jgi:hypothetical protein
MPQPVAAPVDPEDDVRVLLAVDGGLMRGLKANATMAAAGARFVRETRTAPRYRLYSMRDEYPALEPVADGRGGAITVEVWSVTPAGLIQIYRREPPWLGLAWITLADGASILGVVGEVAGVEGQRDITSWGGWRAYIEREGIAG